MDRKENTPTKGRGNCVAETRDSTANHPVPQSLPVQRTHLLKHLQERGRITTIEARNILGIMHPAARIQELRESGYNIETYWQLEADVTGKRHKQGLYVLMTGKGGMHDLIRIKDALALIPVHDRETCQRIGVILKSTLGENGFFHWDLWVSQILEHNIQDARILWDGLKPSYRADINSVFIEAEKHGSKLDMKESQC